MPHQVSFFDIAPKLTGFCSGTGEVRPDCGAFRLPDSGEDLGEMGTFFARWLRTHIETYRPVSVGYESPLLLPTDTLLVVRQIYGLGMVLETVCHDEYGIPTFEKDPKELKRELTGNPSASKDDMVEVALLCGIDLPRTFEEGKRDAADAFAGWKCGLRDLNPRESAKWDQLIWSKGRGGLL